MPGDHASGRRPTRVHALRMAAAFAIAATLVLAIAVSWLGVQDLQLRARVAALEEMRQNQRAMVLSFGLLPGITRACIDTRNGNAGLIEARLAKTWLLERVFPV